MDISKHTLTIKNNSNFFSTQTLFLLRAGKLSMYLCLGIWLYVMLCPWHWSMSLTS